MPLINMPVDVSYSPDLGRSETSLVKLELSETDSFPRTVDKTGGYSVA